MRPPERVCTDGSSGSAKEQQLSTAILMKKPSLEGKGGCSSLYGGKEGKPKASDIDSAWAKLFLEKPPKAM